ncbi:DMT family transporter [Streptomyces sp. HNM0574]|uniref:DMT family transporter n=1 Tax=Streptomyces sp. HNM0574 TaxID=2714954 RepID=UPI00146CEDF3|nr:DMT family transporter [Streptomyces sp. HNM0574]NLU66266.1 DMT family transporter [Streptomyces sp. HNM0574]
MTTQDSAIAPERIAVPGTSEGPPGRTDGTPGAAPSVRRGLLLAAVGVCCFSLTFPGTVWALEGFGPWSSTALRTVIAAAIAGVAMLILRVPVPERRHWGGIAVAATGVVLGFPLLTTLALQTSTTSHSAVVVGLLPLTTAVYSCLRTGARPSRLFWAAAVAGAVVVIGFTLVQSGGVPTTGDLYLLVALLVCAAGYAEGGRLARELPGIQIIGWALLGCLPLAVPGAALALWLEGGAELTPHSVAGLLWVAAGSQLAGLLCWYRGMGIAGVARASQTQLAQPLLTLVWSVLLLGEQLAPAAPVAAVAVLVCIVVVQRSRA